MDGWEILKRAIPHGAAKAVALRIGVTANHVRRWMREPLSDEAPVGTGQRSPLDRVCDLVDAVFLVNPAGAAFIVDHVAGHHHQLIQASLDPEHWDKKVHAADLLREAVEAVNCLNLDAPDNETLAELVELDEQLERAIKQLRTRRSALGGGSDRQAASEPDRGGSRSGSRGGSR